MVDLPAAGDRLQRGDFERAGGVPSVPCPDLRGVRSESGSGHRVARHADRGGHLVPAIGGSPHRLAARRSVGGFSAAQRCRASRGGLRDFRDPTAARPARRRRDHQPGVDRLRRESGDPDSRGFEPRGSGGPGESTAAGRRGIRRVASRMERSRCGRLRYRAGRGVRLAGRGAVPAVADVDGGRHRRRNRPSGGTRLGHRRLLCGDGRGREPRGAADRTRRGVGSAGRRRCRAGGPGGVAVARSRGKHLGGRANGPSRPGVRVDGRERSGHGHAGRGHLPRDRVPAGGRVLPGASLVGAHLRVRGRVEAGPQPWERAPCRLPSTAFGSRLAGLGIPALHGRRRVRTVARESTEPTPVQIPASCGNAYAGSA